MSKNVCPNCGRGIIAVITDTMEGSRVQQGSENVCEIDEKYFKATVVHMGNTVPYETTLE